jgi:thiol-disulfide isomerase/thioredoxin
VILRRLTSRRLVAVVLTPVAVVIALAGCTQSSAALSNPGYVTGSGVYKEIPVKDRTSPVTYTGKTETGATISSKQFLGKVHVLNFWYAGCAPCFVEAPRLESVYKSYKGSVPFLGVNTYDQAAVAATFEEKRGITYPSIIDANTASVMYAFAGKVAPDAMPTTLVIDKHGRVAARVTGLLESTSILKSLVNTVIAEGQ